MFKRLWKNEKGLTLIELLAVVVILGIIAGIAVPSIGGLIDNSKQDAHVANARQMIASVKMVISSEAVLPTSTTVTSRHIPLQYLYDNGYLDAIADPDNTTDGYVEGSATLPAIDAAAPTTGSYVTVNKSAANVYTYSVKLVNASRGVQTLGTGVTGTAGTAVAENLLARGVVVP